MDSCEHVVAEAAAVVARLLTDCPLLSVVATSRERLNLEGETVWRVPPMSVPDEDSRPSAMDTSDAVRLFVERARSVQPGFLLDASNAAAALTICRRLEGIPLAIELAAARMTTLSAAEIVPRLEDRFRLLTRGSRNVVSRQQTLRATVDWSYRLLQPAERTLLHRMSVFVASADADAVQEVCAFAPLDRAEVLDALTGLVEKSVVQVDAAGDAMRYRLLETIREYAAEKLVADDDHANEVRDRHLGRYSRLASEAFEADKRRGSAAGHRRLWREIDDARAALDWSRGDPEVELDLLGSMRLLWVMHAPVEGFERLRDVLGRAPVTMTPGRMKAVWAWSALGAITEWRGEWFVPIEDLQSMVLELNDPYMLGHLQLGLGYFSERQVRDLERARVHMRSAVELFESCNAGPGCVMAMGSLGSVEMELGRPDEARRWIERAVELSRAVDDQHGAIGAYFHLGRLELDHGSPSKALDSYVSGLKLVEAGDLLSLAYQVEGIGCALADAEPKYALRLFAAASRLRALAATPRAVPWAPRVEESERRARVTLPAEEVRMTWANGEALTAEALTAEVLGRFGDQKPRRPVGHGGLSRREMEIAGLVATGMTSRAIAQKLFLAERTVETHLSQIMTKLGFNSRAQVAAWMVEQREKVTAPPRDA